MKDLFHQSRPWGSFEPKPVERLLLRLSRTLSGRRLPGIALLLRRPLKYRKAPPLDVELWGLRLRLGRRDSVSESRMLFTPCLFDPVERAAIQERLQPGGVFLDVGANVGGYSFWVYSRFGTDVRILSIEPDPELCERIAFNAATNEAKTLRLLRVALSDREGSGVLRIGTRNRGENRLEDDVSSADESSPTVPLKTLAQLAKEEGVERIDVLKIDIEGMEHRVLRHFFDHAPRILHPRAILVEDHDTAEHRALFSLLETLGYRTALRTSRNVLVELGIA
jgi:FkbM family methyltransferase